MTGARPLGATGLPVSGLGLGTVELGMPYGLGLPPPPRDDEAVRLLRRALDLGITYFDTAAGYGRSEEILGAAFRGVSPPPVVATKATVRPRPEAAPLKGVELQRHVEESVARSLRRLGVETADLVQIHNADGPFVSTELTEVMARLQERGWVRHWGASTYGVSDAWHVLGHAEHFASMQVACSALDRRLEPTILPACRARGLGVVLRSVFLKGVLSERWRQLPDRLAPLRQAAAGLAEVAAGMGLSLATLALRYAAYRPWAHVTLVGTASVAELESNLAAYAAGPLSPDAEDAVRAITVTDENLLNPASWDR